MRGLTDSEGEQRELGLGGMRERESQNHAVFLNGILVSKTSHAGLKVFV